MSVLFYGRTVRSDRPWIAMNFLNAWHSIAPTFSFNTSFYFLSNFFSININISSMLYIVIALHLRSKVDSGDNDRFFDLACTNFELFS